MKFLWLILFITGMGWSQETYTSLGSDYYYAGQKEAKFEWLERDLKLSQETITIISYGKENTDIQKWRIQEREVNHDTKGTTIVLYTTLASSGNKLPAIFYIFSDLDDNTDKIIFEVPKEFQNQLPEASPIAVHFYIEPREF